MSLLGIIISSFLLGLIFLGSRRTASLAMICGVLFLTQGQSIEIFGLKIFAIRLLGYGLLLRVLCRKEYKVNMQNRIDLYLCILYAYTTLVYVLRSKSIQFAVVAEGLDAICCYFGFRGLIKTINDFKWLLLKTAFCVVPYSLIVGIEYFTGKNFFNAMGGVLEGAFVRDGKPRCMGSFRYSVTLGVFAATFMSCYIGLFSLKMNRIQALCGSGACLLIVIFSNSGGSLTALGTVALCWTLWKIRTRMKTVRLGIAFGLILLHIIMVPPVWYIFAKASIITGGDGWHRSYLIDVALAQLHRWWLFGMPMSETATWFPYTVNGGADITNQYIQYGLNAGLIALIIFIILIYKTFQLTGKSLVNIRKHGITNNRDEHLLWGIGGAIAAHTISFFGVTYFDQLYAAWYLHIALVASMYEYYKRRIYVKSLEEIRINNQLNIRNHPINAACTQHIVA